MQVTLRLKCSHSRTASHCPAMPMASDTHLLLSNGQQQVAVLRCFMSCTVHCSLWACEAGATEYSHTYAFGAEPPAVRLPLVSGRKLWWDVQSKQLQMQAGLLLGMSQQKVTLQLQTGGLHAPLKLL